MTEWIWRKTAQGATVTCRDCGASYSGNPAAINVLEANHDPAVCAVRALTPAAKRMRGTR